MKSALTRDQILAAIDLRIEAVEVPNWGGTVYVRNLSGKARDKFESSRYRMKGREVEVVHDNTRATLLALSVCDEEGRLLFTEADIPAIGEKNADDLDKLFAVAQRLSGLRQADADDKLKN